MLSIKCMVDQKSCEVIVWKLSKHLKPIRESDWDSHLILMWMLPCIVSRWSQEIFLEVKVYFRGNPAEVGLWQLIKEGLYQLSVSWTSNLNQWLLVMSKWSLWCFGSSQVTWGQWRSQFKNLLNTGPSGGKVAGTPKVSCIGYQLWVKSN